MKRLKILVIMLAVLAVLTVAYLIWNAVAGNGEDTDTETETPTYAVPSVDGEEVSSLALKIRRPAEEGAEGTETVTELKLTLGSGGNWAWSANPTVPIDADKVSALTSAFEGLTTMHVLADVAAENLAEYGMDVPYIEAEFGLSAGGSRTFLIGIRNSFNGLYYMMDAADRTMLYLVDGAVPSALDVTVYDLVRFDTLPEIEQGKFTSVTCRVGTDTLVYTYYPAGNPNDYTDAYKWYLSVNGGKETALSGEAATKLENALMYGYFSGCEAYDNSRDAELGLASPAAEVTVKYNLTQTVTDQNTGTQTSVTTPKEYRLIFGGKDAEGMYYVRTESSALVYTAAYSEVYDLLFAGDAAALCPAELMSLNMDTVTGFRIVVGDHVINEVITHSDSETTYRDEAGVLLYSEDFLSLVQALSGVRASSNTAYFEKEGGGQTADGSELLRAEIRLNGAAVTEAVLRVTKYNDSYCRVSFLDRDDQLITNADAQQMCDAVLAFFK